VKHGIYLDLPAKRALKALAQLEELGFDHVVLCPCDATGWAWSGRQIAAVLAEAERRSLAATVMVWPMAPLSSAQARELAVKAKGWPGLELDLEGSYAGPSAPGWLEVLLDELGQGRVPACNTFPSRLVHPVTAPAVAKILAGGGELHLQAYSVTHPPGQSVPAPYTDPVWGPGRAQKRAWRLAHGQATSLVLAAWDQRWAGVTPAESMREAYLAAVGCGARVVRWWSAKWVVGRAAGGAVRELLRAGF
jgi:hypothetical protein